jgi:hypothetical protein
MTTTPPTASGSSLIVALEHTWATIRQYHPELPEVVFITGTGLRHTNTVSTDATWGHFGAARWVAGRPQPTTPPATEAGQDAKLNLAVDRRPELLWPVSASPKAPPTPCSPSCTKPPTP